MARRGGSWVVRVDTFGKSFVFMVLSSNLRRWRRLFCRFWVISEHNYARKTFRLQEKPDFAWMWLEKGS
jgi:hypothetical protein